MFKIVLKKNQITFPKNLHAAFLNPPTCSQPTGKILTAALVSVPAWPAEDPDVIHLFFSWAALGSKPGYPGSTGHRCQVSARSHKVTRSISATSLTDDLTKQCGYVGMLGAAALAGLVQGSDPRGQDGQPGTWAQLAASGFLHWMYFFLKSWQLCFEKEAALKVNIVSG